MARFAGYRTSRRGSTYKSLRSALRYARRAGAKTGRLIADLRKNGEKVMSNVSEAVDKAVDEAVDKAVGALEAILGERLALLAADMSGRRAAIFEQIREQQAKLGKLEALDRLSEPAYPAPFPLWLRPWFLVLELLFVAAVEMILIKPALGALPDYGQDTQWLIAAALGLLLAVVVLLTSKALAYVIQSPAHRDSDRLWLQFWTITTLAALGVLCLIALPVFLTVAREDLGAVVEVLNDMTQIDQTPGGLSGVPEPTAPADQQQPAADPLEGLRPNLWFTLVLQEAALIVGLIGATLFALGEPYRRALKVAAGYARVEKEVAKAHDQLGAVASKERAALQAELETRDFRLSEFSDRLKRSVIEAGQIPPDATPPRDHAAWIDAYYSLLPADLEAQIEEDIRQIKEEIGQIKDRRSVPKLPAAQLGVLAEANSKGPQAHVALPGKQHD